MRCRKLRLHIVQFQFLVDIDQDVALEEFVQAGPVHLARLKHDISVAQNHRSPQSPRVFDCIQRLRIEAVGKGIIDHEMRHGQQLRIARLLDAVTLQRAQIVGVSEFATQLLEDFPIVLFGGLTYLICEVALQVFRHAIVIEQRIVYIEKEHGGRVGVRVIHKVSQVKVALSCQKIGAQVAPVTWACQVPSLVVQRRRSTIDYQPRRGTVTLPHKPGETVFAPLRSRSSWNTSIQPSIVASTRAPAGLANSAGNTTRNSASAARSTRWWPAAVKPKP